MEYNKRVMTTAHRRVRCERVLRLKLGMSYREYFASILADVHVLVKSKINTDKNWREFLDSRPPACPVEEAKIIKFYATRPDGLMAARMCD